MRNKASFFIIILFLASIILSGCETTQGFVKDVNNAATLTYQRGAKILNYSKGGILKVDSWMRKNLW